MGLPLEITESGKIRMTNDGKIIVFNTSVRFDHSSTGITETNYEGQGDYDILTRSIGYIGHANYPNSLVYPNTIYNKWISDIEIIPISNGVIDGIVNTSYGFSERVSQIYAKWIGDWPVSTFIGYDYHDDYLNVNCSISDIRVIGIAKGFGGITTDGSLKYIPVLGYTITFFIEKYIHNRGVSYNVTPGYDLTASGNLNLKCVCPLSFIKNGKVIAYSLSSLSKSDFTLATQDSKIKLYDFGTIAPSNPYVEVDKYNIFHSVGDNSNILFPTPYFYRSNQDVSVGCHFSNASRCVIGNGNLQEGTYNYSSGGIYANTSSINYTMNCETGEIPALYLSGTVKFPIDKLRRAITWNYRENQS